MSPLCSKTTSPSVNSHAGTRCLVPSRTTVASAVIVFAKASINLTRIESVPDKPGTYAIFIDFEGSIKDPRVEAAVKAVSAMAEDFRILGCYRETRIQ